MLWLYSNDVRLYVSSATHGASPEADEGNRDIARAMGDMGAQQVVIEADPEDVRRAVMARLEASSDAEKLLADAGEDVNAVIDEIVRASDGMFVLAASLVDRKLRDLASLARRGDARAGNDEGETQPLFYMRATADHIGHNTCELSFRKGEIIAVTEADTEDSFHRLWSGVVRGIAGKFPKAVARKIESPGVPHRRSEAEHDPYGEWQKVLAAVENHRSQSRDTVFTVLCWLAHAEGPLAMSDLVKSLAWDVTAPPGYRLTCGQGGGVGVEVEIVDESVGGEAPPTRSAASITDIGKGLVHVDEEKGTVSVLDSLRLSDLDLGALFPGGHSMIARGCLQILMRGASTAAPCTMGNPDLASYAARSWGYHVRLSHDDTLDELVADYLTKLCDAQRTWMEDRPMPFMDVYRAIETDDDTPVLKAAGLGLDGVIKILLGRHSYDLDAPNNEGDTAMSVAVHRSFVSTAKLLCRHGASVNGTTESCDGTFGIVSSQSLLEMAARNNDEVMIALLVKLGPDRNTPLGSRAPLGTAVSSGSLDAARMLLLHGAEVTDRDMTEAASSGCLELAKLILERSGDTLAGLRDRDAEWKSSMLFSAIDGGSIPVAEYMIRTLGASVNHFDRYKGSVVHQAARQQDLDMVKFLMEGNADELDPLLPYRESDAWNEWHQGETAVEAAMRVREGAWDVVDYLLERMPPGIPGPVILGMAAGALKREKVELAKRLIGMAVPPLEHTRMTCKASLMGTAAAGNYAEIVGMLLDGSMAAGITDKHGVTPLHMAAKRNSAEAVEVMMSRGVDININAATTCGVTPLHMAISKGHLETMAVLVRHGADLSLKAEDGSSALVAAGCSGHLDAALALLEHDVSINDINLDGESILHYAVMDGHAELVRKLLQLGADTTISSRRGGTALHIAAHQGDEKIVQLLIDAGADVEAGYQYSGSRYEPDERGIGDPEVSWHYPGVRRPARPGWWSKTEPGWTPLHCAACSGHEGIIQLLLSSGAGIGATGCEGETPLHVAASAARPTVVEFLAEKGADIQAKTSTSETALHWAARAAAAVEAKKAANRGKCACRQHKDEMYERAHPNETKAECAELLLGLGADPTARNTDGATPLMLAVAAGHTDVTLVLFKLAEAATSTAAAYAELLRGIALRENASAQALTDLTASFTETPESQAAWCDVLGGACLAGKLDMAQLAISKGATLPSRVGPQGRNPLHHLVTHDEMRGPRELHDLTKLIELVLTTHCGADIHARDTAGRNALHLAVTARGAGSTLTVSRHQNVRARIVTALLTAGAAPNTRTPAGDTALHLACAAGDDKVVEVLLRHGADVDIRNAALRTPLHAAVTGWAFADIVEQLLGAGAHPSPRDAEGATPLHRIREIRNHNALDVLLDAGADVAAPARDGDLPLHRAVRRGNETVVRRLLEVGADVTARGAKGRTCLHIAARYGHVDMLGQLGAETYALLDAVDEVGWTAAHHAAVRGHERVLDALLAMGREQGVDVFGAGVGAVPLENLVSGDKEDRLWRLVQDRDSVWTTQVAVVAS